ncbi:MAG: hypothetical protein KZQ66_13390 [Candidatus Thiodiazotropha sp. (ex Lucinoma aequizonata)]|nr:hypothetical protein [Candidatus Thiodiazotropha sp. (ex Lucinoma aequizonata)]MCU7894885.1 hypothetical protein [Candidatus Thiodiazotropha sp. (ex Lucinoma aequizonata)]MCU7899284.1 hypothetical protein [Candidatus Thiodiazotropha sp. (ex Lucinoma aequizonata)]MCU7902863.1 hypothetical protein [Candidatus Thiodiazotropha sp. (ex Lucinoma aequizonata)]MCU7910519.1 hypothetical protein [Candidatus Thiodiazotropha sp. (ex Lucinoma aequizonata)]
MKDEIYLSLSPGTLPEGMSAETKRFIKNLMREVETSLEGLQENMTNSVEQMREKIVNIKSKLTLAELHVIQVSGFKVV